MKRHGINALEDALVRIDELLDEPLQIVVIGGAAVALLTRDAAVATKDIDTFDLLPTDATRLAKAGEIVGVEIGPAGVAELPYNFEDRLTRILPTLAKLAVFLPDRHDLVLSKVLRWWEGDEHQVLRLHSHRPLDQATLVLRYRTEMTQAMGSLERRRDNFLACIEALFGDLEAARVRDEIA